MSKATIKTALEAIFIPAPASTDASLDGVAGAIWDAIVAGVFDPAHYSLTTLTSGTSTAVAFDPLDQANWPASTFIENTDWKQNTTAAGISFAPATGDFTIAAAGLYRITVNWYILASVSAQTNAIQLRKNGTQFWTASPTVHSSVDPAEYSIGILQDFTAGQKLSLWPDPSVAMNVEKGLTVTIERVG